MSEQGKQSLPYPTGVSIKEDEITISLSNGRTVTTPLSLHPWLASASPEQQAKFELCRYSIDWPSLDEGIDIAWVLSYQNSQKRRLNTES